MGFVGVVAGAAGFCVPWGDCENPFDTVRLLANIVAQSIHRLTELLLFIGFPLVPTSALRSRCIGGLTESGSGEPNRKTLALQILIPDAYAALIVLEQ